MFPTGHKDEHNLHDFIAWGMRRAAEAERTGQRFIVVEQTQPYSARYGSKLYEHERLIQYILTMCLGRSILVIERVPTGWRIYDHKNLVGVTAVGNAHIASLAKAKAA